MKATYSLPLLAVLLTLVSCNEKISPQLQDANSTTLPPPTSAPKEYVFKVVDDSPVILNYQLHRAGAGNATAKCEVKKNVPLSNNIFRYDPESDITCFFEAEELSLYHAGMSFKVEASPDTCEFVGYEAFGFYTRMPGNSSTTFYELECTNDATNETHINDLPNSIRERLAIHNGYANCGQLVDQKLVDANRGAFAVQNDEDLCRFNYKDGEQEMCDVGVINIQSVQMTYENDTGTTKYEIHPRTVRCGGRTANCVGGPTKQISAVHNRKVEITKADLGVPFEKTYSYEGLINRGNGGRYTNREYVNFRRDLASLFINFGNPNIDATTYINAFGVPSRSRSYDPKLMDNYSYNKKMDGTELVTSAEIDTASIVSDGLGIEYYTAKPLAAEPFLGLGESNTVNPFYTFTCLDKGQDVKARIRLVVRDWDRIYPSSPDHMELISDITSGSAARMDLGLANMEINSENDHLLMFNDYYDWDDFIKMDRTLDSINSGSYSPSGTVWRPADGWFERSLFPGSDL